MKGVKCQGSTATDECELENEWEVRFMSVFVEAELLTYELQSSSARGTLESSPRGALEQAT